MDSVSTIVGIATPLGSGGIGIVRLSGARSLEIATSIFSGEKLRDRVATVGTISIANLRDTAIAIYFKSPHSFTGEDVVELQCHGGYLWLTKVVEALVNNGAVMAERGEFSRRAYLNGKMSLEQAEAIIDMINAQSDKALANASAILMGGLGKRLERIEQSLIEVSAETEASLDYPDEDIKHITLNQIAPRIAKIKAEIEKLLNSYSRAEIVTNGISVAMLGKPNVGKSSLFNALIEKERSIVTDIAGTTTDTVSHSIHYQGVRINFFDTAGIRKGGHKIEELGIERSKAVLNECDIACVIFDLASAPDNYDRDILRLVQGKDCIFVLNKSDAQNSSENAKQFKSLVGAKTITVSARTGENISKIHEQIFARAMSSVNNDDIVITNARHAHELGQAVTALSRACGAVTNGFLDCVAQDIWVALNHLSNITGKNVGDAVLDEVFSRFCLGK